MALLLSAWALFRPTAGGGDLFVHADKLVHGLIFLLLAGATRWRFGRRRVALAALVAYAVGSELVQAVLLPDRSGDPYDVLADLVGVAAGWVLVRR